MPGMIDVEVIDTPEAATVALGPIRSRILAELAEPASAATLASRLGMGRQKVNYHVRALESHGLAKVAEKRRWGGLTERLLVATARSYIVSPQALGPVAADPDRSADRLSASYLLALAARVIREVSALMRRSRETPSRRLCGAGGLVMEIETRRVALNDVEIELTSMEFELLRILLESRGRVLTREMLLRKLRGIDADIYDRSVDMLISRLRKKLADDSRSPRYIKTVWRTGYQFVGASDS